MVGAFGSGCEHTGGPYGGIGWPDVRLHRHCRHVYADNMGRSILPDSTSCIPLLSGGLGLEGEGPVVSAVVS